MDKALQNLLDLQNVDVQLNDVRACLGEFPKKLAELESRVAKVRAGLEESKAAQLATIKDRKKYELDVEQWKERVRKYRDQTAQVKTNEAYKALQHEVQMAEEEIAKAEDRLLEQMVASEEYDRRVKASERTLKEAEEVARVERSKLEAAKATLDKDLAEMESARARVVAEIPENLLAHYDRIAKKHKGVALAEVRDEKCAACGMIVRPHVLQEMRRGGDHEMFHCETCTRILYYIEPEESGHAEPSSAAAASAASTTAPSTES